MKYVEVEGWTAEDEYVSATILAYEDESDDALISRGLREEGIIEVGSTKIYWA